MGAQRLRTIISRAVFALSRQLLRHKLGFRVNTADASLSNECSDPIAFLNSQVILLRYQ